MTRLSGPRRDQPRPFSSPAPAAAQSRAATAPASKACSTPTSRPSSRTIASLLPLARGVEVHRERAAPRARRRTLAHGDGERRLRAEARRRRARPSGAHGHDPRRRRADGARRTPRRRKDRKSHGDRDARDSRRGSRGSASTRSARRDSAGRSVPCAERLSRAELVRIANAYFSGIERNDGKGDYPLARRLRAARERPRARRRPRAREPARQGPAERRRRSAASSNSAAGVFFYVTRIRDRRFVLVDPERGLAFAFAFFDNAGGDSRFGTLPDGRSVESGPKIPWTWAIAEVFKIERGLIGPVESVLHQVAVRHGLRLEHVGRVAVERAARLNARRKLLHLEAHAHRTSGVRRRGRRARTAR